MTTFTTPLNLIKPVVGADKDIWGGYWNTNADTLNGIFTPTGTGLAVGLHIGTMTLPDTTTVPGTFKLDGTGLFDALLDNATWRDKTDPTKAFQVKADNLPTATTRHVQVPSADGVLATEGSVRLYVPTGTIMSGYYGATAPAGFVHLIGNTIGDATSGANERANADCQALFTLLWGFNDDTRFPVLPQGSGTTPSRGATAAADWAAHKRLLLPDHRGRSMSAIDNASVLSPGAGAEANSRGGRYGTSANRQPRVYGNINGGGSITNDGANLAYTNGLGTTQDMSNIIGCSGGPALVSVREHSHLVSGNATVLGNVSVTSGAIVNNGANITDAFGVIQPGIAVDVVIAL